MTELSVLAVQNASVLRELNRHSPPESIAALARAFGRDPDNFRKTLKLLEGDGLIDGLALTEAGHEQVRAIGRAEQGRDEMLPKGVALLTVADMRPDPNQPRKAPEPEADEELADSIAARTLLQPPCVWPAGEDGVHPIRFGERRWRALNILIRRGQWDPARRMLCAVRDSDDMEALEEALIENEQRAALHPLDLAESLLKLADAGRSASQIEAIVGGRRKKRSIQQYVKVARDLSAADKAKMRLPETLADGRPNPDHLSINAAIRLTTDARPKPALELTPRLAMTLVEIAHAACLAPEVVNGEPGYARLWTVPTGGPIVQLSDKGLVNLRPQNGAVYAKVLVHSSPAGEYLKGLGFDDNKDICGWKAKVAALTEIGAQAIPPDAERRLWATPELRMPEHERDILPAAPPPEEPRTAFAPEPILQSYTDLVQDLLAPAEQLVMLELAHRIFHAGIDLPGGMRAARVSADYYRDPLVGVLTTGKSMLVFSTRGADGPIAGLTAKGGAWLNAQGFAKGAQGWLITDNDIVKLIVDAEIKFERPDDWEGHLSATAWLNLPAEAPRQDADPAEPPPPPTFQSPLYQQIKEIRGADEADDDAPPPQPKPKLPALEDALRVIRWLDGALAQASIQLDRATIRKLTPADLVQVRALIENAQGAAAPMLAIDAADLERPAPAAVSKHAAAPALDRTRGGEDEADDEAEEMETAVEPAEAQAPAGASDDEADLSDALARLSDA